MSLRSLSSLETVLAVCLRQTAAELALERLPNLIRRFTSNFCNSVVESMIMRRLIVWCLLLVCCAGSAAYADTLYLKNGRSLDGLIKRQDADSIELEVCSGSVIFKRSEVAKIESSSPAETEKLRHGWERQKKESYLRSLQEKTQEELGPQGFEYSDETNSMLVKVVLNGQLKVNLVLDTGASLLVLKKDIAKKLGVDTGKQAQDVTLILADGRHITARYVVLQRVAAAGMQAENVEAAVLLEDIPELRLGDGLLGMSFLKNFNFKIDYRNKRLILERLL